MNTYLIFIVLMACAYGAVSIGIYRYVQREDSEQRIFYVILGVVILSVYFSLMLGAYSSFGDSADFASIMKQMDTTGFYGIYKNHGINYPPLFWYVYYPVCKLLKLVGIPFDPAVRGFVLAIKLPCILMKFILVWIMLKCIPPTQKSADIAIVFFILLNPGIIFTTDYLCQVDLLYIGLEICCITCLVKHKLLPSYFFLVLAFLLKFQAIFITPIVLFATMEQVILSDFQWKIFIQKLIGGLAAIGLIFISYIPFERNINVAFWDNFSNTTAGFGKASQNACNFWMLAGYNGVPIEEYFGPFTCQRWGTIFIVLVVVVSAVLFWRCRKDVTIYPLIAACLMSGTYTFSVKMMARYLYPAIFLIILAYALKPTKQRFVCAVLYSAIYILVIGMDYVVYPWFSYEKSMISTYVISVFEVCTYIYLLYMTWREKNFCGLLQK